jgi:phospholipase/carboxylesterase
VLEETFSRYAVDPARLAVGGFSGGASYALSLGSDTGHLFTYVLAFSPGFMAPAGQAGVPAGLRLARHTHGTIDWLLQP